jgi:hypothetical protein
MRETGVPRSDSLSGYDAACVLEETDLFRQRHMTVLQPTAVLNLLKVTGRTRTREFLKIMD